MGLPASYNFPTAYANDGLTSFNITVIEGGVPVDFTGKEVLMQLRDGSNRIGWSFGSAEGADTIISLLADGIISFPSIPSFTIKPGKYKFDLQATGPSDFVKTYIRGTWEITNDITKTT